MKLPKAPSVYMKKFLDINEQINETMKTHLINDLAEFGVLEDNYDLFFIERANAISLELEKRIIPQETDHQITVDTFYHDYEENELDSDE